MNVSSEMESVVNACLNSGLVVLPANKKAKRPVGIAKWQEKTVADAKAIWGRPLNAEQDAISLVCGKASGNVEIIDFDAKGVKLDPWKNLIPDELIAKLIIEQSPSGGYHVGYRCPVIEGNLKLASESVAVAADNMQGDTGKFTTTIWGKVLPVIDGQAVVELIETRGEGGQCLIAPSPGYELIQGSWASLPTITPYERIVLIEAARSLNRVQKPTRQTITAPVVALPGIVSDGMAEGRDMSKPWNKFNAEATQADVIGMLETMGWSLFTAGNPAQMSRPGITDHAGGSVYEKAEGQLAMFHCFTSDASPFEPEQNYTPFAVYAHAEHKGDIKAAGRALSDKYGMGKKGKDEEGLAYMLMEFAIAQCELWHGTDRTPWATVVIDGHKENWRVESPRFGEWLYGEFFDTTGKIPNDKAIKQAMQILAHKARAGAEYEAFLRIARTATSILIDLGNPKWEAVEITADGWKVISDCPVKFRRTQLMDCLPYPQSGKGGLDLLRQLVRVDDSQWQLVRGYLLDCFKGSGPYHVLCITGEPGSSKSTFCKILKRIIDPQTCQLALKYRQ